jgi:hypothetical protein
MSQTEQTILSSIDDVKLSVSLVELEPTNKLSRQVKQKKPKQSKRKLDEDNIEYVEDLVVPEDFFKMPFVETLGTRPVSIKDKKIAKLEAKKIVYIEKIDKQIEALRTQTEEEVVEEQFVQDEIKFENKLASRKQAVKKDRTPSGMGIETGDEIVMTLEGRTRRLLCLSSSGIGSFQYQTIIYNKGSPINKAFQELVVECGLSKQSRTPYTGYLSLFRNGTLVKKLV